MLDCGFFYRTLRGNGIGFFAGVPDSLLKHFCACLSDLTLPEEHVIAANEGGAVGLAAGHYLATGKPALVYLQNSGQGNAVNPLLSVCDPEVYGIPMLLVMGWRGEPGTHDEPQHGKQGRVMKGLFEAMEIPFEVLSSKEGLVGPQVEHLIEKSLKERRPVALVVKKGTFAQYSAPPVQSPHLLLRETAIETLAGLLPADAVVVATTGHISRELYAYRERHGEGHERDFLMVGGMGHASQVALGVALAQPDRPVFCFDGDGATLMHMGGLALVGQSACRNLKHVVFNNGAHGSVGGQPTVGFAVGFREIAYACGYSCAFSADDLGSLIRAGKELVAEPGPGFLEVRVSADARPDLERPATSPAENKRYLMGFINAS